MCVVEKEMEMQSSPQEKTSKCARCARGLSDPTSQARGMGPVCYGKSGGGVFDKDLEADEKEWERRREHLTLARTPLGDGKFEPYGPEIDLGANWKILRSEISVLPLTCSISVRYNFDTENFEAYGRIHHMAANQPDIVFYSGKDLKAAYREAVAAGPREQAKCDRAVMRSRKGRR